jgi:hypothetical protein
MVTRRAKLTNELWRLVLPKEEPGVLPGGETAEQLPEVATW